MYYTYLLEISLTGIYVHVVHVCFCFYQITAQNNHVWRLLLERKVDAGILLSLSERYSGAAFQIREQYEIIYDSKDDAGETAVLL